jgi:hypothetical protein
MPTTPTFPSIPVPREDLQSLNETCLTMKRTLEMLTGQDQGDTYASHTFVQPGQPEALHNGDLWLCTAKEMSVNIWTGEKWVRVANVTAVTFGETDFNLAQFERRRR